MGSRDPLYRVRVSSSGLIYAVIVGAWAAYLVPMWLRRQDELNEARPTERFSTAIRLLSGKAGMERRYARAAERRRAREGWADDPYAPEADAESGQAGAYEEYAGYDGDGYRSDPDATEEAVDVRAFADPKTMIEAPGSEALTEVLPEARAHRGTSGASPQEGAARPAPVLARPAGSHAEADRRQSAEARAAALEGRRVKQAKRAKLLARRRRTTMMLFLAFTMGSVIAAVQGIALLWVPAIPAVLLSAYIVYLRIQERRRFLLAMDRRRAEEAARTLHARRPGARDSQPAGQRRSAPAEEADTEPGASARAAARPAGRGPQRPRSGRGDAHADRTPGEGQAAAGGHPQRPQRRQDGARDARQAARARTEEQEAAERRALVEQTDHAEWVDQQRARDRDSSDGEGWDPVPVPLPTYVSAPVAPRATRGVDLEAPDAWSSARSSTVPVAEPQPADGAADETARPRHPRERERTPLFDQYEDRPRAANE
ncbi:hypothetical protein ACF06W_18930 [Streptomyces albus]|uniref:divisome protein SepX/GlpR n=1 Tax=Streptomyces albus TaxID=1888 RepID=UPI003702E1D6